MTSLNTRAGGLSSSLRRLGRTIMALGSARVELIAIELQEEKLRAEGKLILLLLAVLFFTMGLLLLALLIVILFWDTYRIFAAVSVTLLYLGIGFGALFALRELKRKSPPPFFATRREFAKDLQMLRGCDG